MAKRRRRRKHLGDSPEVHRQAAEDTVREMRRLSGHLRKAITKSDCQHAVSLMRELSKNAGILAVERRGDTRSRAGRIGRDLGERILFKKFASKCVVRSRLRSR